MTEYWTCRQKKKTEECEQDWDFRVLYKRDAWKAHINTELSKQKKNWMCIRNRGFRMFTCMKSTTCIQTSILQDACLHTASRSYVECTVQASFCTRFWFLVIYSFRIYRINIQAFIWASMMHLSPILLAGQCWRSWAAKRSMGHACLVEMSVTPSDGELTHHNDWHPSGVQYTTASIILH